jgi:hypothetical protein
MKAKLYLLAVATLLTGGKLSAQTDVTATYLQNPSFEADAATCTSSNQVTNSADGLRGWTTTSLSGWTLTTGGVTSLLITEDCYTDNNFGKAGKMSDGTYAYYLRQGWSSGTSSLSQTLSNLPEGTYKLVVHQKTGYANSANSALSIKLSGANVNTSSTIAFSAGSAGCMTENAWTASSVIFNVESAQDVTLTLNVNWLSGGSCILLDDIQLIQYPLGYEEPKDPEISGDTEESVTSYTEGVITNTFVQEATMKSDLLQMLADFMTYCKNDFQDCAAPNSVEEVCGAFKGENTMGNNEQGVRPNADLSMICAFLAKYGKNKVTLPTGVTWDDVENMAMKSLVFAYSTHKANKLKVCSGGNYWGSTSTSDYVWESSLWAMSVCYSAFFQWDKLTETQKGYIYNLVKAECNYELNRTIPTGYVGDTKAEENGWETNILACALGLFPDDELAEQWFDRLRAFAINCYSHPTDAIDGTVIDPDYDNTTVRSLYKGQNLYKDYTLQNHNLFHTSYQNVVMQELGESMLALKMFQQGLKGEEKWKTNALMHNNQKVMDLVLNELALADGELAMPNGNDWSLFLYDQITSYSTMACFLGDPNALLLENLAYKYIQARQKTTSDGSWLLRADVGARRMGVEAHRVMMTWLMHEMASTADIQPTEWEDFRAAHETAKIFDCQNIVRANTKDRFTCFSWSTGLSSYTGYFAQNCPDKNKIIVPYRANNTGNLLGWYTVSGKSINATPVVSGNYELKGSGYVMNGSLKTNDEALTQCFAFYSTPGNAFIYVDYVRANTASTITGARGGLLAISTDELTKTQRTLYHENGRFQGNGSSTKEFETSWINIDNEIGVVAPGQKTMAFGDRGANNSIYTSKLYPLYSNESRSVKVGEIDRRSLVYYSSVSAEATQEYAKSAISLKDSLPTGWNGIIAQDPDGTRYLLVSNFYGVKSTTMNVPKTEEGTPVLSVPTTVTDSVSTATFSLTRNHSVGDALHVYITSGEIVAQQATDSISAYLTNNGTSKATIGVRIRTAEGDVVGNVKVPAGKTVLVYIKNGSLKSRSTTFLLGDANEDDRLSVTDITEIASYILNATADEETVERVDMDSDGKITLDDITQLASILLGIEKE